MTNKRSVWIQYEALLKPDGPHAPTIEVMIEGVSDRLADIADEITVLANNAGARATRAQVNSEPGRQSIAEAEERAYLRALEIVRRTLRVVAEC